jgi:hypothetical protein
MEAAMVAAFMPAAARADIVTDWNVTTLRVLQTAQVAGGASSRTLAMVHVAMSDASPPGCQDANRDANSGRREPAALKNP